MQNLKLETKPVVITDQNLKDIKGMTFKIKFEAMGTAEECERIVKLLQSMAPEDVLKVTDKSK